MARSKRVVWKRFGRISSAVIVACFFLPFFGVSCAGMDMVTASGVDMVGGCRPGGLLMEQNKHTSPGHAAAMAGVTGPVALAVSGGGDSIALMHLAARHAAAHGFSPPVVLTVDHGLRRGSAADAKKVVQWARALGLKPMARIVSW